MAAVFFQNYFTPYRHALYEKLAALGVNFSVVYAQKPEDEGRKWSESTSKTGFLVFHCRRFIFGRQIIFFPPFSIITNPEVKDFILLDNAPTNLSMLFVGLFLKILNKRIFLWVEHIPNRPASPLVLIYQHFFSRGLLLLSDKIFVLSNLSEKYVKRLNPTADCVLLPQAVPCDQGLNPRTMDSVLMPRLNASGKRVFKFGYLGSIEGRKNLVGLISAFKLLQKRSNMESVLVVAGGAISSDYDVGSANVQFIGYVDAEARTAFFQSIDVLVLPSIHDPWGLVINEAVMYGVLPLATKSCGASELVEKIDPRLVVDADLSGLTSGLVKCLEYTDLDWHHFYKVRPALLDFFSLKNCAEIISAQLKSVE